VDTKQINEVESESERTKVEPILLLPEEVATLMKVSRWTVYELVKRKKLPATKIGRGIRIPTKAVVDFINSGGADILTGKGA